MTLDKCIEPLKFPRIIIYCIILGLISCGTNRELTENAKYFTKLNDSLLKVSPVKYEPNLQAGDILYISVNTANDASAKLYNQPNFYAGSNLATSSSSNSTLGYLIDENGFITFPFVGKIKAAGQTKSAFADSLTMAVRKDVSDAILSVRILNFKVTVIGEVTHGGSFSVPTERLTVMDAIGFAGDLTIYGRRDNIKIIREVQGHREMGVLNLNDGNIFNSPFFYLQQNDIVYVEPNNRKIPNTDQAILRNISIGLGILSTITLLITAISKF